MTKETSVVERVWYVLADQKRWRMPMIAPNWFWPAPTCSVAAVSVVALAFSDGPKPESPIADPLLFWA